MLSMIVLISGLERRLLDDGDPLEGRKKRGSKARAGVR
jgi:hypothetical protein